MVLSHFKVVSSLVSFSLLKKLIIESVNFCQSSFRSNNLTRFFLLEQTFRTALTMKLPMSADLRMFFG